MANELLFRDWFRIAEIMTPSHGALGPDRITPSVVQMRYTGFKDANGTHIFEDDIIQGRKGQYQVVWSVERGAWVIANYETVDDIRFNIRTEYDFLFEVVESVYVIGNIWQGITHED